MDDVRNEILQAALRQFLKQGAWKTSIKNIIEPLGISTKTVYKYFANKEELLECALLLYRSQQYDLMADVLKTKPPVPLLFDVWYSAMTRECRVNKAFFHDLHYYYPAVEQKVEGIIIKRIWQELSEVINRGIKQGFIRAGVDTGIFFQAMSTVYKDVVRTGNYKKFKAPADKLFVHTMAIFIRGICTEKGVNQLDAHIAEVMEFEAAASTN
jgi:AcrR family transcriptional regulator